MLALCALLGLFALFNIFFSLTPMLRLNERIEVEFPKMLALPFKERVEKMSEMRVQQEEVLQLRPSDPFGWARLAYLRKVTLGSPEEAFAALRMSDLSSPQEPRQLLERALMWRELRAAENADQQAYQDILWRRAFRMQPKETWKAVHAKNLAPEVSAAVQQESDIGEWWKGFEARNP